MWSPYRPPPIPDLRGILGHHTRLVGNSKSAHAIAWKKFSHFCDARHEDPEVASAQTVGDFVASLYRDRRSVSMMCAAASALRWRLTMFRSWTPAHSATVRQVIGDAATNRTMAQRIHHAQTAPIGRREFGLIVRAGKKELGKVKTDYARADIWTDLAIISVMRDGMLRPGQASTLDWEHITRHPADGSAEGMLVVVGSKDCPHGEVDAFYLSPTSMKFLDAIGRPQGGPVFVSRRGRRADPRTICRRIRRAVQRAGLEGRFSGDSPRLGMTRELIEAGYSTVDIETVRRWGGHDKPVEHVRRRGVLNNAVARWHRNMETQRRKGRRK